MDGMRFTRVDDNCSFGLELVFHKQGNRVVQYKCTQGAWKKTEYTFRVITRDESHFAELLDSQGNVAVTIEIQMVGNSATFVTELTYYVPDTKEYFTMISNKSKEK